MEQKEELIEKVERYLSGKLSRKEVVEDQDQELSSEELDEAIDLFKTSKDLIELSGLKEDLKSIHKDYMAESEAPPKRNNLWIWATMAMAASVLAIAIFSGVFKTGTPLFEDYFEPYADVVTSRGSNDPENPMAVNFLSGMNLYSIGNYSAALTEFAKIDPDSITSTVLFYEGIAFMATSQFDKAIENFENLSLGEKNPYWLQTHWYLALSYWQSGNIDKSRALLNSLDKRSRSYDLAQGLLKKLSKVSD